MDKITAESKLHRGMKGSIVVTNQVGEHGKNIYRIIRIISRIVG